MMPLHPIVIGMLLPKNIASAKLIGANTLRVMVCPGIMLSVDGRAAAGYWLANGSLDTEASVGSEVFD